jgi:hypothetical protein
MLTSFNISNAQFVPPYATRAENELEDPCCFDHFVPSLSPRITGAPVRREACSEPMIGRGRQAAGHKQMGGIFGLFFL